jgi:hypothetical protein
LRYHLRDPSRITQPVLDPHIRRNGRPSKRSPQNLSAAAIRSIRWARDIDVHLYEVAKRVAAARESHARLCAELDHGTTEWRERCGRHAVCTIRVREWLARLLRRAPPQGCNAHPSRRQASGLWARVTGVTKWPSHHTRRPSVRNATRQDWKKMRLARQQAHLSTLTSSIGAGFR